MPSNDKLSEFLDACNNDVESYEKGPVSGYKKKVSVWNGLAHKGIKGALDTAREDFKLNSEVEVVSFLTQIPFSQYTLDGEQKALEKPPGYLKDKNVKVDSYIFTFHSDDPIFSFCGYLAFYFDPVKSEWIVKSMKYNSSKRKDSRSGTMLNAFLKADKRRSK